ncbi:NUDIX domain-containing protein [Candidatus Microgenomates bacterium]|nr:NUDIX domain-containing protein [Candidatus Microgenomates bacterium]
MREETSAGGVVFKKNDKEVSFLLLKDQNDSWTFPKGLIESGEDSRDAAQREVSEETGIQQLVFFKELEPIKYWYRWEGDLIHKTVHYYLFETKGEETPVPQKEEGITEVRWFTPDEAGKIIGYRKTNQKILNEAIEAIGIGSEQ